MIDTLPIKSVPWKLTCKQLLVMIKGLAQNVAAWLSTRKIYITTGFNHLCISEWISQFITCPPGYIQYMMIEQWPFNTYRVNRVSTKAEDTFVSYLILDFLICTLYICTLLFLYCCTAVPLILSLSLEPSGFQTFTSSNYPFAFS